MPTATLKTPERWAEMLQGLLDQGQDVAEVEAVMRYALQDGSWWRSRILTVKAFAENYAKMLDQMKRETAIQFLETVPQNWKAVTVDEWKALKHQWEKTEEKGKIEPP